MAGSDDGEGQHACELAPARRWLMIDRAECAETKRTLAGVSAGFHRGEEWVHNGDYVATHGVG